MSRCAGVPGSHSRDLPTRATDAVVLEAGELPRGCSVLTAEEIQMAIHSKTSTRMSGGTERVAGFL
ncbi:hypothetical protein SSRG_01416 [Streptomyces griseoflavus Tu4000]|uniref:Uncharacterized protein n=1 Tax=Streptomyces griseoflavus Tu4000 TaxID=467200 RepID=D9XQR1_9ACTN|nr:hypothetical protein SSRG_01416 [Streptomyces griseoflavus Tu4000]